MIKAKNKKGSKQKKFEVLYEYIEPKTTEEKKEQEKMLEGIYFPIFDEIQKELNKIWTKPYLII